MGVGEFIGDFFRKTLSCFSRVNRQYYQQSMYLVFACRSLEEPDPRYQGQMREYQRLLREISDSIRRAVERADEKGCRGDLEQANALLEEYCEKYRKPVVISDEHRQRNNVPVSFAAAVEDDAQAGKSTIKYKKELDEKLNKMKISKVPIDLLMWEDEPIRLNRFKPGGLELEYKSNRISVKVEGNASLTMLLHRMIYGDIIPGMNDITLDVVPQFYPSFPDMASKLLQSMSCLNPWILIEEHHRRDVTSFHLIIERKQANRSIRLKKDIIDLPERFGNAWHVKDTFDLLVVRDRSPAHFLSLWNGKDEYNSPWTYPVEGEVQPVRPGHEIPHQFTTSEDTLVETSGNDTTAVEMPRPFGKHSLSIHHSSELARSESTISPSARAVGRLSPSAPSASEPKKEPASRPRRKVGGALVSRMVNKYEGLSQSGQKK